jgi:hypothetical protein
MNSSKLKFYSVFTGLIFIFLSMFLSCSDKTGGNGEHSQRVAAADSIRNYYDLALESLGEMKEIKNKLQERFESLENSDSTLAKVILDINQDIATSEGLTEKHRILIKQHKDYIDQHENSALSADKIGMFHQQIQNDFSTVKADLLQIEGFLYQAKSKADNFLNEDLGVIFYKK